MPTYISDVRCGKCNKSISQNWVYRGRLELLCPDCNLTFPWPWKVGLKEFKCQRCGQSPHFATSDNEHGVNNPILLCKNCVAEIAISYLEVATRSMSRSLFLGLGYLLLATGIIITVLTLIVDPSGFRTVPFIGPLFGGVMLGGLILIFTSKDLAERSGKRAAKARDILQRIKNDSVNAEQKLAAFGLEAGGVLPPTIQYAQEALKRAEG